jgi:hypothetical protein
LAVLYAILRSINQWYAIAVLWLYVLMFAVAFAMIFVFPLAPIVLVFLGVLGLGVANIASKLLRQRERGLARRLIGHGQCPHCRHANQYGQTTERFICVRCSSEFLPNGAEVDIHVDQPQTA